MGVSIGRQIRRLREAARLQAADLADALGLAPSAVSNIEHDRRSVKAAELSTIASFLGVSQLAILEPDSLLGRLPVAHRTNGDGSAASHSLMRLTSLAELHQVLSDGGHPAAVRNVDPPVRGASWLEHANALAAWMHQSPLPAAERDSHLTGLARAIENGLGVDVMMESLGSEAPLGLSITDPEFSFIMVNTDQLRSRALFTLAHELGHVLSRDGAAINIDSDMRARTDGERMANAFAAALLMPEPEIRETIDRFGRGADCLARMILRFGVSYETLIYRLHNLQIINATGRDSLRSIGWTGLVAHLDDPDIKRRLLDARGARPHRRPPTLLAARCLAGVLDGSVGPGPLARLLEVDLDELIEALNAADEAAHTIDRDYSTPRDPPEVLVRSFDEDPVAA